MGSVVLTRSVYVIEHRAMRRADPLRRENSGLLVIDGRIERFASVTAARLAMREHGLSSREWRIVDEHTVDG